MVRPGWIVLPENRAAYQAVERVRGCVSGPARRREVNPLVLHGPPGSGKTHLVELLIERLTADRPGLTARVLAAADLPGRAGDDLPAAREADLVAVEGLHQLPEVGVEPFVALLDHCLARSRQVVCTAQTGPALLPALPVRLTSRLAQGLVVALEAPGPESRLDFLRQRAQERGLAVAEPVIAWLAQSIAGSARQLDGALTRLEGLQAALGRAAGLTEVQEVFGDDAEARRPSVDRIVRRVGQYFRVDPDDLCSRRRSRQVLLPRQVGMYLARRLTSLSLEQIGAYFGGRDHSTVLHACRKVEAALSDDAGLGGAVRALHADLA